GRFPSPRTPGGRVLEEIARRHGRTPRQVALRFLTRGDVFTIPKSGNPEHVRENAGGTGWELAPEEVVAIDRAFPAPAHDVPLGMIWPLPRRRPARAAVELPHGLEHGRQVLHRRARLHVVDAVEDEAAALG